MKENTKPSSHQAGRVLCKTIIIILLILTVLSATVFFISKSSLQKAKEDHTVPKLFGYYYLACTEDMFEGKEISFANPGDLILFHQVLPANVTPGMVCLYVTDYASEDPNKIFPTLALSSIVDGDAIQYTLKDFINPQNTLNITATDLFAVAAYRLPGLGNFVSWLQTPFAVFVIVLIPTLVLVILLMLYLVLFLLRTSKPKHSIQKKPARELSTPSEQQSSSQEKEMPAGIKSGQTQIKSETVSTLRNALFDEGQLQIFYPEEDIVQNIRNASDPSLSQETMEFDLQAIKRKLNKEQPNHAVLPSDSAEDSTSESLSKMEINIAQEKVQLSFNDAPKEKLMIHEQENGVLIETQKYEATVSIDIQKKDDQNQ